MISESHDGLDVGAAVEHAPKGPVAACVVNVAVTDFAAVIVTVHVPIPVHPAPDHPPKLEVDPGDAVNLTEVPDVNL